VRERERESESESESESERESESESESESERERDLRAFLVVGYFAAFCLGDKPCVCGMCVWNGCVSREMQNRERKPSTQTGLTIVITRLNHCNNYIYYTRYLDQAPPAPRGYPPLAPQSHQHVTRCATQRLLIFFLFS
jgi:hypothetical protein